MAHRILVVDDEPDICDTLKDLFCMLPDSTVETARSYAEGRAKSLGFDWDVIVSDQRLGDGHGVDILSEAAQQRPGTLLVLMSAFQDFDAIIRGVNAAHIDRFFQKPYDPDEMLRWLKQALHDRDHAPASAARPGPFRRIGTPGASTARQPAQRP